MQQQSRSDSGVSDVSKNIKYFKEYNFWYAWNHLFDHESPSLIFRIEKIIYLETNGRESDENGSDYNSDFGEDQDSSGEFLISDMDDEQKKKKTK